MIKSMVDGEHLCNEMRKRERIVALSARKFCMTVPPLSQLTTPIRLHPDAHPLKYASVGASEEALGSQLSHWQPRHKDCRRFFVVKKTFRDAG